MAAANCSDPARLLQRGQRALLSARPLRGKLHPMTQIISAVLIALVALSTHLGAAPPANAPLANGRTILFVDDHNLLYRAGTKRVLVPAKRHAERALIDMARPWETAIGY